MFSTLQQPFILLNHSDKVNNLFGIELNDCLELLGEIIPAVLASSMEPQNPGPATIIYITDSLTS
jgi:hypothetical protein